MPYERILIDADACPVTDIAIAAAQRHGLNCILLCDEAHYFSREGAQTITVTRGADSADFRLVNLANSLDIVITQDYGLAAMCLAKNACVINQDGRRYTKDNIDGLLAFRHEAKKARMAGGRTKGPKKREKAQNIRFEQALEDILQSESQD